MGLEDKLQRIIRNQELQDILVTILEFRKYKLIDYTVITDLSDYEKVMEKDNSNKTSLWRKKGTNTYAVIGLLEQLKTGQTYQSYELDYSDPSLIKEASQVLEIKQNGISSGIRAFLQVLGWLSIVLGAASGLFLLQAGILIALATFLGSATVGAILLALDRILYHIFMIQKQTEK